MTVFFILEIAVGPHKLRQVLASVLRARKHALGNGEATHAHSETSLGDAVKSGRKLDCSARNRSEIHLFSIERRCRRFRDAPT